MKAIQQSREKDNLEQWKSARDSGAIKTTSSGLKRTPIHRGWAPRACLPKELMPKCRTSIAARQETTSDGIPIKKTESAPAAPNRGLQNP